jgi:hypothetical protein
MVIITDATTASLASGMTMYGAKGTNPPAM